MKIRTKTLRAGPGGVLPIGSVMEVSEAEGRAAIAGGYAEEVKEQVKEKASAAQSKKRAPRAPESTSLRQPERAVQPPAPPAGPAKE